MKEEVVVSLTKLILSICLIFLNSWIVQVCWNNMEFGKEITYWQALGLLFLCDILFKDSGGFKSKGNNE
jgi:hypothetical protein